MKKSILLFALLTFSLFSCSNNDNETSAVDSNQIVATWLLVNAKLDGAEVTSSYKIQFTSDNRAKFSYRNPTSNTTFGADDVENGNYTFKDSNLTIMWDSYDPGHGTTQYQILELTSTKLIIKSVISGEGTLVETYAK